MTGQDITEADAIELERMLVTLERLGGIGPHLAEVTRHATAAIIAVVDVVSPVEVDVTWGEAA